MLEKMLAYMRLHQMAMAEGPVLLAVSGGADSVAMAHLFHQAKFDFAIAHCNFKLRGDESDGDEKFVRGMAQCYNVKVHVKNFDTATYAAGQKQSIQMAARTLRYDWFNELCITEGFQRIATAHHLDDHAETILINVTRGLAAKGIRPAAGNLIRPLRFATRAEIENYIAEHELAFRTDSSNESDAYVRNKIRHHVMPVLREINPSLVHTMDAGSAHTEALQHLTEIFIAQQLALITEKSGDDVRLNIDKLRALPEAETLLFYWLLPAGFVPDVAVQAARAMNAEAGKKFYSHTHSLIKDRTHFILAPWHQPDHKEYVVREEDEEIYTPLARLELKQMDVSQEMISELLEADKSDPNIAIVDYGKVEFPMVLRHWREGDKFIPLGMQGSKKISDLLIDVKMPLHKKELVLVLCSGGDIVWVCGVRVADNYKVENSSNRVLKLRIQAQ